MSEAEPVDLCVKIESADSNDEERDRLARLLLKEIRELNVETVEPAKGGPVPERAKSGEAFLAGAVAMTLLPSVLPPLVALLQDWTARVRTQHRSLTLEFSSGGQLIKLEYDPATTDIHRLMADLMPHLQAPGAGGLHLASGADTNIGGDAVGRDKNITTIVQAQPGATVIVNPPGSE
jgi:hypothetical protein